MNRIAFLFIIAMLMGCIHFDTPTQQVTIPEKPPLRLTTEEILRAEDGDRIIVIFPNGVEEPVVIFDDETDQWFASAKVVTP